MKTTLLASTIIVGLFAQAAMADDNRGGPRGMHGMMPEFSQLDANSDGELTVEEMQGAREAMFAAADTNGDGALSAEEIGTQAQARMAKHAERMIEHLDENDDGMLQADEMPEPRGGERRAQRMFDRADADESGTISEDEFDAAKEKMGGHGRRG